MRPLLVEAPEEGQCFDYRQLVRELGILQLNPEPLPQRRSVRSPAKSEYLDFSGVRGGEPFADLNRCRLTGAIRTQQAEAFAGPDLERDTVDGNDVLVGFPQPADVQGSSTGRVRHAPSLLAGRSVCPERHSLVLAAIAFTLTLRFVRHHETALLARAERALQEVPAAKH